MASTRILLALLIPAFVAAQDLEEQVDAVVQKNLKALRIPGLAIGVARGGKVLLAKGYGRADLENNVVVEADTVFRAGSITKQFTAALIMKLTEAGKLSLDDELHKHLPDFPKKKHRITLRQLLSHTAGVRSYTSLKEKWRKRSRLDLDHEDLLAVFKDEPLDFPPGTQWVYSNSGYYLLGMVIEKVTGLTYQKHLERTLLRPLGMGRTYYDDTRRIIKKRAHGYDVRGRSTRNADFISMKQPFAAGGLATTVGDLIVWVQAVAAGKVVSEDSLATMTTRTLLKSGRSVDYGFGLALGNLAGKRIIAHGGSINGFSCNLSWLPDHDDTVIAVLSNSVSSGPRMLATQIGDIVRATK
ncbi:MAG: hypothetical protein CMJ83_15160 [Planctomycetes bacterium]|nr:hypothetical protein [Planctomycetota bacterium]